QKELVFRLHGFEAYTDVYSFIAASDVLYHAGKTIRDVLSELGLNNDFVGILEDEFIVLTDSKDLAMLEEKISQNFKEKVRTFYSFADAERGGIVMPDESFVPMMSLTTGAPD